MYGVERYIEDTMSMLDHIERQDEVICQQELFVVLCTDSAAREREALRVFEKKSLELMHAARKKLGFFKITGCPWP